MVIDLTPRPTIWIKEEVSQLSTCINMDSDISELVAGDTKLFFASCTNSRRNLIKELFVSDGTESGTTMVKDIFDCPPNTGEVMINYEGV